MPTGVGYESGRQGFETEKGSKSLARSVASFPQRKKQAQQRADVIGLPGALAGAQGKGPLGGLFEGLVANRLRTIESLSGAQRNAAQNALEARGLGQSSVLGQAFGDISRNAQLAGQQAQSQVQGLKFGLVQSALDFEREKDLTRLRADVAQDRTSWKDKFLGTLGQIAAFAGGGGFDTGGGSTTGSSGTTFENPQAILNYF